MKRMTEEQREKHLLYLRDRNEGYEWKGGKTKLPKPSKKSIIDNYTGLELLNMVDDDVIQNYLRVKKLKRIKDKI